MGNDLDFLTEHKADNNKKLRRNGGVDGVAPAGIEPTSKVPETFVLSIERRSRLTLHMMPQAMQVVKG